MTPADFDNAVREFKVVVNRHVEKIFGPVVRWLNHLLGGRR